MKSSNIPFFSLEIELDRMEGVLGGTAAVLTVRELVLDGGELVI